MGIRRAFSAVLVPLCLGAGTGCESRDTEEDTSSSPAAPPTEEVFDLEELGPGVWAAIVRPNPPMYVFANALVVEQEDGLVVSDSHSSPSAARAMIDQLADRFGEPVRVVVNTHFHGDHVYGNESYVDAFPDVRIVVHANTARDIEAKLRPFIQEEMDGLPGSIEQREQWIGRR